MHEPGDVKRLYPHDASDGVPHDNVAAIDRCGLMRLRLASLGSAGSRGSAGGVSVIDFATRRVVARWPIPYATSPDMGNVIADGKALSVSGRYDRGHDPHRVTVRPQPGRDALGYTSNMR